MIKANTTLTVDTGLGPFSVLARSILLEPGAQIVAKGLVVQGVGTLGGLIGLVADDTITLQNLGTKHAQVAVPGTFGQLVLQAGNDITLNGSLDAHAIDSDGNGGDVMVTSQQGNLTVSGPGIRADGGNDVDNGASGGTVTLEAHGSVTIDAPIDDSDGDCGDACETDVTADTGDVTVTANGSIDVSGMGSVASGGDVQIMAAGAVQISGPILGTATGIKGADGEGGDGGGLSISAGSNVTLAAAVSLSGAALDGDGGDVDVEAAGDILLAATGSLTVPTVGRGRRRHGLRQLERRERHHQRPGRRERRRVRRLDRGRRRGHGHDHQLAERRLEQADGGRWWNRRHDHHPGLYDLRAGERHHLEHGSGTRARQRDEPPRRVRAHGARLRAGCGHRGRRSNPAQRPRGAEYRQHHLHGVLRFDAHAEPVRAPRAVVRHHDHDDHDDGHEHYQRRRDHHAHDAAHDRDRRYDHHHDHRRDHDVAGNDHHRREHAADDGRRPATARSCRWWASTRSTVGSACSSLELGTLPVEMLGGKKIGHQLGVSLDRATNAMQAAQGGKKVTANLRRARKQLSVFMKALKRAQRKGMPPDVSSRLQTLASEAMDELGTLRAGAQ